MTRIQYTRCFQEFYKLTTYVILFYLTFFMLCELLLYISGILYLLRYMYNLTCN